MYNLSSPDLEYYPDILTKLTDNDFACSSSLRIILDAMDQLIGERSTHLNLICSKITITIYMLIK